jgi:hypothetical protein
MRAGMVSVMAAAEMVLAGQAAQATTTVTESPAIQANAHRFLHSAIQRCSYGGAHHRFTGPLSGAVLIHEAGPP